jgi:hypothetical protein
MYVDFLNKKEKRNKNAKKVKNVGMYCKNFFPALHTGKTDNDIFCLLICKPKEDLISAVSK